MCIGFSAFSQEEGLNADREIIYKTVNKFELKLHLFEPEGFQI